MSYLLIVGAKSDIAKALAREYAEHGYDLLLAARKSQELEAFAKDIHVRTQRDVRCLDLDIQNDTTIDHFYTNLEVKPLGVISVVGYLGDQRQAQQDFREAQKIIEINYTGVVHLLNTVAADFEQRREGFIIGISSVAGDRGRKSNYLYGSAKAALTAYLSGLRNRLSDAKVQVLTVKPGFVATTMTAKMDLPGWLTAQPGEVAKDIFKAQQAGKNVLYTKGLWRWLMLVIKVIPEWVFKRMKL